MAHTPSPIEAVIGCDCIQCRCIGLLDEVYHYAINRVGIVNLDAYDVILDITCDASERIERAYLGR